MTASGGAEVVHDDFLRGLANVETLHDARLHEREGEQEAAREGEDRERRRPAHEGAVRQHVAHEIGQRGGGAGALSADRDRQHRPWQEGADEHGQVDPEAGSANSAQLVEDARDEACRSDQRGALPEAAALGRSGVRDQQQERSSPGETDERRERANHHRDITGGSACGAGGVGGMGVRGSSGGRGSGPGGNGSVGGPGSRGSGRGSGSGSGD